MARVKITGDTRDAQQKVTKLRKEVERLDREAKKPKKINVQGRGGITGGLGKVGGGIGGALQVAGGNLISQIIQGLQQYIPAVARVVSGSLGKALGLEELEKSVTRVTPKIKNMVDAIETFSNPGEEALNRADRIDALDDERRSHNSKSLAEEYAYSKAFSNIAGVNGTQIVDRLQALIDMATSGNISEMEKAWGQLRGFGVSYSDLEKGSTWQVLVKMLSAYRTAGLDGQNELEPSLQQIVGKRQMAAIRKIGDGGELHKQAQLLEEEFNTRIQDQLKILEEASKSEITRAIADIQSMAIPSEGLHYINDEANNHLSRATLKTGMIGDTATGALSLDNLWGEIMTDIQPAIDEFKTKSIKNYLLNSLGFGGGGVEDTTSDFSTIEVNNAQLNVANASPLLVEPPTELFTSGSLTLHPLENNLPIPTNSENPTLSPINGTIQGTTTLPIEEVAAPKISETQEVLGDSNKELKTALDALLQGIKENTTSTKRVSDAFNTISINGSNGGGYFQ